MAQAPREIPLEGKFIFLFAFLRLGQLIDWGWLNGKNFYRFTEGENRRCFSSKPLLKPNSFSRKFHRTKFYCSQSCLEFFLFNLDNTLARMRMMEKEIVQAT